MYQDLLLVLKEKLDGEIEDEMEKPINKHSRILAIRSLWSKVIGGLDK